MRRRNWFQLQLHQVCPSSPSPSSPSSPLFFFFFCFFGRRRWRKVVGEEECRGVGENRRSSMSGKKKRELRLLRPNPKRHHFGLVCILKKKSKHPKTTSFWGSCFFFFCKYTSKTKSFWASSNKNDVVLCIQTLSLVKTPQIHFQSWIEGERRRRRLKEVFFFIFPIFIVKKILKKVEKHSQKILKNREKKFQKKL